MQKRVITLLMIIVGASLGISFLPSAWQAIGQQSNGWLNNTFTNSLLGALIFFLLSLLLAKHISAIIKQVEQKLSEVSLTSLRCDRCDHRIDFRCCDLDPSLQYGNSIRQ